MIATRRGYGASESHPPGRPRRHSGEIGGSGCGQAVIATDDMQSTAFADLIHRLMEADISVAFVPSFGGYRLWM